MKYITAKYNFKILHKCYVVLITIKNLKEGESIILSTI